ncbi:helix-turn-helix domain-containing protein [Lactobacillus sp. wkB10]|uniref:helix-turn-helix domain-containing protein n=1 Tax=Lactobacillus sp. wkB10 TaxID=1545701 RepID=UPI00055967CB|nr:helix-turn-helix transcriptional regulator [Lactobacillus sp. wkB10]
MSRFGITIRKLRISRRITQQELANDLFDRSELSKIEHSELTVSYENEIELIKRLSLTPDEFEYISNNYTLSFKRRLLHRFFELKISIDTADNSIADIEALLQDCFLVENDGDIGRIKTILEALLLANKPKGLDKAKKMVQPIWFDYLAKTKILTITDIYVLNTILFAFDYETANEIIAKIITVIDRDYPFKKSLKIDTLINQAMIEMLDHKFKLAADNMLKLKPLIKKLGQYDKLLVIRARIAVCQKDKTKALEQVSLLEKIEAQQLANNLKSEIKEFL